MNPDLQNYNRVPTSEEYIEQIAVLSEMSSLIFHGVIDDNSPYWDVITQGMAFARNTAIAYFFNCTMYDAQYIHCYMNNLPFNFIEEEGAPPISQNVRDMLEELYKKS